MSVADFISDWLGLSAEKCANDLSGGEKMGSLLYLKDWHFVKVGWK